jgi:3-methyladenine DNA glycosylase AlkD
MPITGVDPNPRPPMTAAEVVAALEKLGDAQTKKTLLRHGVKEPLFGVKIGDMKPIQKKIKTDHALALALYDTGIYDAMYFAGLIADPPRMTKAELREWLKGATSTTLCGFTVPWCASESPHGVELALEWIESPKESVAAAGWSTYGCVVALKPDAELDLAGIEKLLDRVKAEVHAAPNRVKYAMNHFVIAVGCYVVPLNKKAKAVGKAVGKVDVDVGDTDCKVPEVVPYIEKVEARGTVGKKRKTVRC